MLFDATNFGVFTSTDVSDGEKDAILFFCVCIPFYYESKESFLEDAIKTYQLVVLAPVHWTVRRISTQSCADKSLCYLIFC